MTAVLRVHLVCIALAACLPYLNALSNDFAFDDHGLIGKNRIVQQLDLTAMFTQDYWAGYTEESSGLYRPLTLLSFGLEYALVGAQPRFYHLNNILLHLCICLLIYCLIGQLFDPATALLTALLFAVHPVHTEAVTGIAGRADLLSSALVLTALLCSIYVRLHHRARLQYLSVLPFALALLCKEQAVILPVLLAIVDLFLWRKGRVPRWFIGEYAAHIATIGLYLSGRWIVLKGLLVSRIEFLDNPLIALPLDLRALNAFDISFKYLQLLIFPHQLSADYSFASIPITQSHTGLGIIGALAILGASALIIRSFFRQPSAWSFAAVWFAACFALVSNIVVPIGTIMAERLLYLPSLGFALLAAQLLLHLSTRKTWKLWCALLLLLYAGRTWTRNQDWRNNETLFAATVELYPNNVKALQGLGTALAARGAWNEAVSTYRRALAVYPKADEVYYHLGLVLWPLNRHSEALQAFQQTIALRPDYAEAHLNAGATYHKLGRLDKALASYLKAVELKPSYWPSWQNLADTYRELGHNTEAASAYLHLLELVPDHPKRTAIETWLDALPPP